MNAEQLDTWKQLVQQCETQCASQFYSSINVASKIRSEAIVAAGELVELVTPELPPLLERLARFAFGAGEWYDEQHGDDSDNASALAARIREALEANNEN